MCSRTRSAESICQMQVTPCPHASTTCPKLCCCRVRKRTSEHLRRPSAEADKLVLSGRRLFYVEKAYQPRTATELPNPRFGVDSYSFLIPLCLFSRLHLWKTGPLLPLIKEVTLILAFGSDTRRTSVPGELPWVLLAWHTRGTSVLWVTRVLLVGCVRGDQSWVGLPPFCLAYLPCYWVAGVLRWLTRL